MMPPEKQSLMDYWWKELKKLSAAFYDRGLRKGDVVCLYADKSITGVITVYATVSLGVILTPCRPSHTAGRSMYMNITQIKRPAV